MIRKLGFVFAAALALCGAPSMSWAQGFYKETVTTPSTPGYTASIFSPGLKFGGHSEMFLISGRAPEDANGHLVYPNNAPAQLAFILASTDEMLAAAGYTRDNIVFWDFTVTPSYNYADFLDTFAQLSDYFGNVADKPAAGTLRYVQGLVFNGQKVELEFWCAK